jgi:hypothetical protein
MKTRLAVVQRDGRSVLTIPRPGEAGRHPAEALDAESLQKLEAWLNEPFVGEDDPEAGKVLDLLAWIAEKALDGDEEAGKALDMLAWLTETRARPCPIEDRVGWPLSIAEVEAYAPRFLKPDPSMMRRQKMLRDDPDSAVGIERDLFDSWFDNLRAEFNPDRGDTKEELAEAYRVAVERATLTGAAESPKVRVALAFGSDRLRALGIIEAPTSNGAEAAPGIATARLADVEPERVDWLWHPRIPRGKMTLLVGDPSAGKSTLTCAIAAAVTTGMPLPGDNASPDAGGPADVLVISAEDGAADTIRPRMEAAGADLHRVHVLTGDEALSLRDPEAMQDVADTIRRLTPALVVIDPLSAYLGDTDSWKDSKLRAVLTPLSRLAEGHGCAVLGIVHLNKGSDKALYRVMGSIGFVAAARSVLLAGHEPDNPENRALVQSKSNLAREAQPEGYRIVGVTLREDGDNAIPTSRVEWTGTSDLTAERICARADESEPSAVDEAEGFLRAELASGPVESKAVKRAAREAGLSWGSVRRAKDRLGVKAWRESHGNDGAGAWLWRLP